MQSQLQASTMETSRASIRIVLAVEHELFRTGLRALLQREQDFDVAAEAADGLEAVRLATQILPDILLIDLFIPEISATGVLRHLASVGSPVRTFLLASGEDKEQITEAFRLGARGVVLRNSATSVLVQGLRTIMNGQLWVGADSVGDVGMQIQSLTDFPTAAARPRNFGLTKRELDVICAVVAGDSNKDIAKKFSISGDTVKHHLSNIFDKLGVYNRLELALFAIQHGLMHKLKTGASGFSDS